MSLISILTPKVLAPLAPALNSSQTRPIVPEVPASIRDS